MKIALAQLNITVGDIIGNAAKIGRFAKQAHDEGADLLLTPELSICGYPPEDLLLREDFCDKCVEQLKVLAARLPPITVIVGHPSREKKQIYNAASVLQNGKVIATYYKQNLPNYTVFDERRYFTSGNKEVLFNVKNLRVGINICEDIWTSDFYTDLNHHSRDSRSASPVLQSMRAGAQVLLVLNASPFHLGKHHRRLELVQSMAKKNKLPIIFCNMVGGQDELVFDGKSFVTNADGDVIHQMPGWIEETALIEFKDDVPMKGTISPEQSEEADVYEALKVGVRDYFKKGGFSKALIGLSGGIDSALTVCVAADALGGESVHAVMMPSQFTSKISLEDSRKIKDTLGVKYSEIPIRGIFDSFYKELETMFAGQPIDSTEENLQSRIRGTLLMALSNKFGALVLATGNKSELSTGYATLYGDMVGGFSVLKDLSKAWVYRLARFRNRKSEVIPNRIITRPPSAELREDQVDEDSLPPYDILDGILKMYVEQNRSIPEIIKSGYALDTVEHIVKLVHNNEYKRRQAPVGIRITPRAYGKDWRYPITNRFRAEG